MNKVILVGNLTRDPEASTTNSGISLCRFSIAVNRAYAGANGERETDYINIVTWRGLADNCAKYLSKGSKVCVVGEVSLRTWAKEDKHGASLEVKAEDVEFLSSRNAEPEAQTPPVDAQTGFQVAETDELPFDLPL